MKSAGLGQAFVVLAQSFGRNEEVAIFLLLSCDGQCVAL
jgi:hypothetical protein